jgi:hypothetical protein
MNSNFQSSVFMELIQKIRVLGVLTLAEAMLCGSQRHPFRLALTKPIAAGTMKKPRNPALVPEWRNWQTR